MCAVGFLFVAIIQFRYSRHLKKWESGLDAANKDKEIRQNWSYPKMLDALLGRYKDLQVIQKCLVDCLNVKSNLVTGGTQSPTHDADSKELADLLSKLLDKRKALDASLVSDMPFFPELEEPFRLCVYNIGEVLRHINRLSFYKLPEMEDYDKGLELIDALTESIDVISKALSDRMK